MRNNWLAIWSEYNEIIWWRWIRRSKKPNQTFKENYELEMVDVMERQTWVDNICKGVRDEIYSTKKVFFFINKEEWNWKKKYFENPWTESYRTETNPLLLIYHFPFVPQHLSSSALRLSLLFFLTFDIIHHTRIKYIFLLSRVIKIRSQAVVFDCSSFKWYLRKKNMVANGQGESIEDLFILIMEVKKN